MGLFQFLALVLASFVVAVRAQLSPSFYGQTCPRVKDIVKTRIQTAARRDPRIGASLLRLHFHDCFVNGCDASILLDATDDMESEKDAAPNFNSVRGFELIDQIKKDLEATCPGVVSCADIITIAAQVSVTMAAGPTWAVLLGRKDGMTASRQLADSNLPGPFSTVDVLQSMFADQGLDLRDVVALSGAHTFGFARCLFVTGRLYNFSGPNPDPTLNRQYFQNLTKQCPRNGNGNVLVNLDATTPTRFDNVYYGNLLSGKGLLRSDQLLFSTPGSLSVPIVNSFARSQSAFFSSFILSMTKMANIGVLTGNEGEVRTNCRVVNGGSIRSTSPDDLVSTI